MKKFKTRIVTFHPCIYCKFIKESLGSVQDSGKLQCLVAHILSAMLTSVVQIKQAHRLGSLKT